MASIQLLNINAREEPLKQVMIAIFQTHQLHLSNSHQDNDEKSVK
jgi:hypothetical protein